MVPFTDMLDALIEFVVRFVVEFVFYTILYAIGWVMLKTVTLGRYPPPRSEKHNEELVALFPVATLFVWLALALS
jgi:hypothetical protein